MFLRWSFGVHSQTFTVVEKNVHLLYSGQFHRHIVTCRNGVRNVGAHSYLQDIGNTKHKQSYTPLPSSSTSGLEEIGESQIE